MATKKVPVGAKVRFHRFGYALSGRVMEDHGPIGVGKRNLYIVRYELGKGNWRDTMLGREEIEDVEYTPPDARRRREIEYVEPYDHPDGFTLSAEQKHARPLAAFLRSQGLRFTEDAEAIEGEIGFLVDKTVPWDDFVGIVNEWKRRYAEKSI